MEREARRHDVAMTWAALLLVAIAAMFGGASRENPLRLALVELGALPLLVLSLRRHLGPGSPSGLAIPLAILGCAVAIPVIQLIPLPPTLWTALPGQAPRLEALRLAGLAPGWRPISLAPDDTWGALLALTPPVAMFLGATCLDRAARERLTFVWISAAAIGLALGLAQLASPGGGLAYPYAITNTGSLVGWFANRNHEAGALLASLPFAAVLARSAARKGPVWGAWAMGVFGLVAVAALGVIRSRAGVILAGPVLVGCAILAWRGRGLASRRGALAAALAVLVVGLVAWFGASPVLDRFTAPTGAEFRLEAWPIVAKAAGDTLPFGAGLGAFDLVFRAVEPLRLVAANYFNHAHNDYLELWLETGWLGAAALLAFAVWFATVAARAWTRGGGLIRAASLAVLVLMAQSLVDYPLRTEALAVWFAFCCGVLATPDEIRSAPS